MKFVNKDFTDLSEQNVITPQYQTFVGRPIGGSDRSSPKVDLHTSHQISDHEPDTSFCLELGIDSRWQMIVTRNRSNRVEGPGHRSRHFVLTAYMSKISGPLLFYSTYNSTFRDPGTGRITLPSYLSLVAIFLGSSRRGSRRSRGTLLLTHYIIQDITV